MVSFEQIIVVRSKTRLEQLIERFNTKQQAQFYLERSGANFDAYQREHDVFYQALGSLINTVQGKLRHKVIDRTYLPTFIFSESDLIIVIGQDGLVANTAKYVNNQPILAINPDPLSYDGILLPFQVNDLKTVLQKTLENKYSTHQITMAEAAFSDGQRLLAFNDFFIGPKSHTSARYKIQHAGEEEIQSSSGIIVSTGAGSTGWLSSIQNMVKGLGGRTFVSQMDWEINRLFFAVREPFISATSSAGICSGVITKQNTLKVESAMIENGIVFSDGIEADAILFNAGQKVEIGIAKEKANLVVK